jgi:hypothetical protein
VFFVTQWLKKFTFGELASLGSEFQSSRVQEFKGSRVQEFKGSKVQGFKGSGEVL